MSDSSDEGENFRYNFRDEESDDERPNKRRKTTKEPILRSRGLGFVSAKAQDEEDGQDEAEDDEDPDDERPTMGLGMGTGAFRSAFNIGEYNSEAARKSPSPEISSGTQTPSMTGRGPSAFGAGGKIQKNSFAARMMAKQGYVEGQGLGKSGQGITAPIQTQVLQSRVGLGHGSQSEERPKKPKPKPGDTSRGRTSGASTPKLKPPPKKAKYNVAAIESRGLHVPDTMKSIIIDATGSEARTVSSLSGFSTPTSETLPNESESAKAATRIKMQLQAYADAWDVTKEQESRLELELSQVEAFSSLYIAEVQRYQDLITNFERVSTDDSGEAREWTHIIQRLQELQDQFADYIEEQNLPEKAAACLEAPFRRVLVDWEPLQEPAHLLESLQSIGALLEIEKAAAYRHRERTTCFETLLLQHWYPRVRTAFKEWNVYDPEKATDLVNAWKPILSPWLLYKIMDEIVLPKLIEAVRRFPKTVELSRGISRSTSNKRQAAPALHSWIIEWWSLLSSEDLALERFPELRHLIKSKLTSETWPDWKQLLGGKRHSAKPARPSTAAPVQSKPAIEDDLSFKDVVEEWCAENDLMLRSSGTSDTLGRLLYRLQDAGTRSRGILIYLQGEVVYDQDGEPYGLDNKLINKALGK